MRKGIDGLSIFVDKYKLDLLDDALFLFCGGRKDRYRGLYFDHDGFVLLYKRLENGSLQWPRDEDEVKKLTRQQLLGYLKNYLFNNLRQLNLLK